MQLVLEARQPLSPSASNRTNGLDSYEYGSDECIEAVDQRDAYLAFGGLAVGVSYSDAPAEGFEVEQVQ